MRNVLAIMIICIYSHNLFALCLTASGVTLRAGPSAKHVATWVAPKYTPLIEIKRSGAWVQVEDMDGDMHWVAANRVTKKIVCVAVKLNTVKLRLGPSAAAEIADIVQVDRHTAFKRIDTKDEWYQVEASWGENYWLREDTVWRPVTSVKFNF